LLALLPLLAMLVIGGILLGTALARAQPRDGKPVLEVGETLQEGFALLKGNWVRFLGLSLLVEGVPEMLLTAYGDEDIPFSLESLFDSLLIGYFLQAMLVRSGIRSLEGRPTDLLGSAWLALRRFLPILGAVLLSWFLVIAGYALLIIPGFMVAAALAVVVPVMVTEEAGVLEALQRSRDLTRGTRAQIIALLLIFAVIAGALSIPIAILAGALGDNVWMTALAAGLGSSINWALLAALLAALYVQLRRRSGDEPMDTLADIFR
jgi:hypothetical protein